jgi:hypothetical protein
MNLQNLWFAVCTAILTGMLVAINFYARDFFEAKSEDYIYGFFTCGALVYICYRIINFFDQ